MKRSASFFTVIFILLFQGTLLAESILLIAADLGEGSGPWPSEISTPLQGAGHTTTQWILSSQGAPGLLDLQAYDAVIWAQGERWHALQSDAMDTLLSFVQEGGKLILEGADIGYDGAGNIPFQQLVLRSQYELDDTNNGSFEVLDQGHPVTEGLPQYFSAQSIPSYPDGVTAQWGGHPLLRYQNTSYTAAVSHPRTVFFAFPLHRFQQSHRNLLLLNSMDFLLSSLHDVAVTSLDLYHENDTVVEVTNWGDFSEDSTVSLWAGPDPDSLVFVDSLPVSLLPMERETLFFPRPVGWSGTFWFKAAVTAVQEEANSENNSLLLSARYVYPAHPRIFFREGDISFLQDRIATSHSDQWQVFINYLEQYVNYDYSTAPEFWFYIDLPAFAFGYAVGGAAAYRDKALELMNIMIQWDIPDDDMPNRERLLALALGFDWVYNGLGAAQREPVAEGIERYMAWVAEAFGTSNNWFQGHERWGMITLCLGALSTVYELPSAPSFMTLSSTPILDHIVPIWEFFGSEDGGNYYGTDYEGIVLRDMVYFFEAWRTATGEDAAASSQFWPKCMEYRAALTHPDMSQVRLDDCWAASVNGYEKCAANWVAGKYQVGMAQWFADEIAEHDTDGNGIQRYEQWWEILWREPGVLPLAPLWTTKHFEKIGQVSMRSNWSDDSPVLHFFCGDFGGGHDHYHQNSFTVFHHGELVLHNGVYDSFGSAHHNGFYQRTIAHNTITVFDPLEDFQGEVNDGGQRFIRNEFGGPLNLQHYQENSHQYECGNILRFHTDLQVDYVMGDATKAYRASKVQSFTRQLVFLKPRFVVVFDRLTVADPEWQVNWHLHSLDPPLVSGKSAAITAGNGVMTCQTLFPLDAVLTSSEVYNVYGVTIPPEEDRWSYEPGDGRLDVSCTKKRRAHRFLHLLTIGDTASPPSDEGLALESRRGIAHGAAFKERTIWFSDKESKEGSYLTEFSFEGSSPSSHHLVFDTEPYARYIVSLNAQPRLNLQASKDGFISFHLPVRTGDVVRVWKSTGEMGVKKKGRSP